MSREVRFGLSTFAISVGLVLLGYFPTRKIAGLDPTGSLIVGVAVSLAASWAGIVPVALMKSRSAVFGPGNVVMAAMLVRLLLALTLALVVALSGKVDRAVFLVWVGISYMVLLAADTHYAVNSSTAATRNEQH